MCPSPPPISTLTNANNHLLAILSAIIYSRLNHLITSTTLSPTETSIRATQPTNTHPASLRTIHKNISIPLTTSISVFPCKLYKDLILLPLQKKLFSALSIGKDLAISQRLYSYSPSPVNPDESGAEDEGALREQELNLEPRVRQRLTSLGHKSGVCIEDEETTATTGWGEEDAQAKRPNRDKVLLNELFDARSFPGERTLEVSTNTHSPRAKKRCKLASQWTRTSPN